MIPRLQTNWDARAAANFMFGGAGAGLMIAAALLDRRPGAVVLALALIACGLTAVWFELGKPLRALHVFFNPFTSWMTRESFAAVLLFAFALLGTLVPDVLALAALLAALFLYCQARMLQGAKGIPAWRAPQAVALLVCTGLAEGAGIALFFRSDAPALGFFALLVVARALAWVRYARAVKSPALEPAGRVLLQVGTGLALAAALAAFYFWPAAWLAGIAALVPGWGLKFALVTRASRKQGFELAHVPVRGSR